MRTLPGWNASSPSKPTITKKKNLLHEIFSKSRIGDTELFAVDENLVKRLFLSLRGEIVFPKNETAESEFEKSVHERR